ncbi:hypothetical protein [Prauserella flavalba]|uniref:hypothetical protein n=1 Tax=Prauserella flavalba TaxID=1477506 RepID=UPI001FEBAAA1|nr:hypothetical protein [Prauserella flavalba]
MVLAAALAIPAALGSPGPGFQAADPDRPTTTSTTGPDEQEATGMVDRRHNPLVAKASFGWLPEVITGVEYGVGDHGDYALAVGQGEYPPMIWLAVYDKEPPLDRLGKMGGQAVSIPAKVGSHEGYWVTVDPGDPLNRGYAYLRWETGDGRWAEINAYYLDFRDPQQALLRVAADVKVEDRAVPLPLHISGLPDNFRLGDVTTLRRPELNDGLPWAVQLFYTVNGANVAFHVKPAGGAPPRFGDPVCKTENELLACVTVDRPVAADLGPIGGAQGLLDRVTLLGLDESRWTDRVIG